MVLRLHFVAEARSGRARLYENPRTGTRLWIPRSVVKSTTKFPPAGTNLPLHECDIADWWLDKNPWPASKQKELSL